jgi:hypothetical protein
VLCLSLYRNSLQICSQPTICQVVH